MSINTKPKEYKLRTIEDIINVINEENLPNLIIDFTNFLKFNLEIKKLQKTIGEENIQIKRSEFGIFHWIDDGKNDQQIKIEVE